MCLAKYVLKINGEAYTYSSSFTVFSLLQYLGFKIDLLVIDYNGTVLPKECWHSTWLKNNDTLEFLTVAGGG